MDFGYAGSDEQIKVSLSHVLFILRKESLKLRRDSRQYSVRLRLRRIEDVTGALNSATRAHLHISENCFFSLSQLTKGFKKLGIQLEGHFRGGL